MVRLFIGIFFMSLSSTNNFDNSTVFARSTSKLTASLEDEHVILDKTANEYYGLEEVSAFIWTLLENPMSLNDIVKNVCSNYDVQEDQCLTDCKEFLSQLKEKGLIEENNN